MFYERTNAGTVEDRPARAPCGHGRMLGCGERATTHRATRLRYSGASTTRLEEQCAWQQRSQIGTWPKDRLEHEGSDHRSERVEDVRLRPGLGLLPGAFDLRSD